MFCLDHKTTRHAPPKMKMTFKKLGEYMEKELANVEVKGRKSACSILDAMAEGMHVMMTTQEEGAGEDNDVDAASEMNEVEDDGGLDMWVTGSDEVEVDREVDREVRNSKRLDGSMVAWRFVEIGVGNPWHFVGTVVGNRWEFRQREGMDKD
jgi:hypothetical protein